MYFEKEVHCLRYKRLNFFPYLTLITFKVVIIGRIELKYCSLDIKQ